MFFPEPAADISTAADPDETSYGKEAVVITVSFVIISRQPGLPADEACGALKSCTWEGAYASYSSRGIIRMIPIELYLVEKEKI